MKILEKNEKGNTLLEILLSLSILSLVILVFFGFFIQSAKFSVNSQNKMSAGQLSQEILEKVKGNFSIVKNDIDGAQKLTTTGWNKLYSTTKTGVYSIDIGNQSYYPQVSIKPAKDQNGEFSNELYYIQVEVGVFEKGVWIKKFETYGFKGI